MSRVRISGLVRLAGDVRRELAGPLTTGQIERLRAEVRKALATVDSILARHSATPADLPLPSQRACRFLAEIDFDKVRPGEAAPAPRVVASPAVQLRWAGLRRYLDIVLTAIAGGSQTPEKIFEGIGRQSAVVENELARREITAEQLTPETRAIRGWLMFFADRANFDGYVSALGRATPAFDAARISSNGRGFPPPLVLHFRPTTSLFRFRKMVSGTTIWLPTPMICFDDGLFAELAGLAFRSSRGRQPIVEAMAGEVYQDLRSELEALGGVVERTAGAVHDLAASFERVNRDYFGGAMPRPRLTWSRRLTRRKFGHYDPIRDTVMASATLDQPDVPEFAVDYIVYHELLHKKLGISWRNGQARVHTADFKNEDRGFRQYEQAEQVLKQLASRRRRHA